MRQRGGGWNGKSLNLGLSDCDFIWKNSMNSLWDFFFFRFYWKWPSIELGLFGGKSKEKKNLSGLNGEIEKLLSSIFHLSSPRPIPFRERQILNELTASKRSSLKAIHQNQSTFQIEKHSEWTSSLWFDSCVSIGKRMVASEWRMSKSRK